jgi:hypothetical protein
MLESEERELLDSWEEYLFQPAAEIYTAKPQDA